MKVLENKQRNPTNTKLLNMQRNFLKDLGLTKADIFDICLFLKNWKKCINFDGLDEY